MDGDRLTSDEIDAIRRSERGVFEPRLLRSAKGKDRLVFVPDERTRDEHLKMLAYFYERHFIHDWKLAETTFVAGGMPGSRILDNVLPHARSQSFYQLDLRDAFGSVDIEVLKQKFDPYDPTPLMRWYMNGLLNPEGRGEKPEPHLRPTGEAKSILDFIDKYGTTPQTKGLPQGAPSSPYLFNFYLQDMDFELDAYAQEHGLIYTRWLDDLTFSSPLKRGVLGEKMRRKIRDIVLSQPGMTIAHHKSKVHDRDRHPIIITGVAIYPDGRIEPNPGLMADAQQAMWDAKLAFDDQDWKLSPEDMATQSLLARVEGYRGALLEMSTEPRSPELTRLLEQSHAIGDMARAAFLFVGEPNVLERMERRIRERDAQVILRFLLGDISVRVDRLANVLGTYYPELNRAQSIIFAEKVIDIFPPDVVEDFESSYEFYYDEWGVPVSIESRRWNTSDYDYYDIWERDITRMVNEAKVNGVGVNTDLVEKLKASLRITSGVESHSVESESPPRAADE
jgi:hypothetical protein